MPFQKTLTLPDQLEMAPRQPSAASQERSAGGSCGGERGGGREGGGEAGGGGGAGGGKEGGGGDGEGGGVDGNGGGGLGVGGGETSTVYVTALETRRRHEPYVPLSSHVSNLRKEHTRHDALARATCAQQTRARKGRRGLGRGRQGEGRTCRQGSWRGRCIGRRARSSPRAPASVLRPRSQPARSHRSPRPR